MGIEGLNELRRWAAQVHYRGQTIILTNGCFDVLHGGHVQLLKSARLLGDHLIVALNSDRSIRRLKGPGRPIYPQKSRKLLREAIRYVDRVVLFNAESELEALVKVLRPDVLVKGGDWKGQRLTGERWAARVAFIPHRCPESSTKVIARMRVSS